MSKINREAQWKKYKEEDALALKRGKLVLASVVAGVVLLLGILWICSDTKDPDSVNISMTPNKNALDPYSYISLGKRLKDLYAKKDKGEPLPLLNPKERAKLLEIFVSGEEGSAFAGSILKFHKKLPSDNELWVSFLKTHTDKLRRLATKDGWYKVKKWLSSFNPEDLGEISKDELVLVNFIKICKDNLDSVDFSSSVRDSLISLFTICSKYQGRRGDAPKFIDLTMIDEVRSNIAFLRAVTDLWKKFYPEEKLSYLHKFITSREIDDTSYRQVCRVLAAIQSPDSLEIILSSLASKSPGLQVQTLEILPKWNLDSSFSRVLRFAKSKNENVALGAIRALSKSNILLYSKQFESFYPTLGTPVKGEAIAALHEAPQDIFPARFILPLAFSNKKLLPSVVAAIKNRPFAYITSFMKDKVDAEPYRIKSATDREIVLTLLKACADTAAAQSVFEAYKRELKGSMNKTTLKEYVDLILAARTNTNDPKITEILKSIASTCPISEVKDYTKNKL